MTGIRPFAARAVLILRNDCRERPQIANRLVLTTERARFDHDPQIRPVAALNRAIWQAR